MPPITDMTMRVGSEPRRRSASLVLYVSGILANDNGSCALGIFFIATPTIMLNGIFNAEGPDRQQMTASQCWTITPKG